MTDRIIVERTVVFRYEMDVPKLTTDLWGEITHNRVEEQFMMEQGNRPKNPHGMMMTAIKVVSIKSRAYFATEEDRK